MSRACKICCMRKLLNLCPLFAVLLLLIWTSSTAFGQSSDNEVTPEVQRLYAQARDAQAQGNVDAAIEKYRQMLKLAPHLAPAYNNLGFLYFNQQDYAHAAEVLERGIKLNPNMPTASALLGISYF